jgi:hypothetical protein
VVVAVAAMRARQRTMIYLNPPSRPSVQMNHPSRPRWPRQWIPPRRQSRRPFYRRLKRPFG